LIHAIDPPEANKHPHPIQSTHPNKQALEVIPRQLADNAGFDSTDILNLLRVKHNVRLSLPVDIV
jgi:hypothetical protein